MISLMMTAAPARPAGVGEGPIRLHAKIKAIWAVLLTLTIAFTGFYRRRSWMRPLQFQLFDVSSDGRAIRNRR
jgi:hypothetical protein